MSPYRFCLWGARHGDVQVGSGLDRRIWAAWRSSLPLTRLAADRTIALRTAREEAIIQQVAAMRRRMGASMQALADGLLRMSAAGISATEAMRRMGASNEAYRASQTRARDGAAKC